MSIDRRVLGVAAMLACLAAGCAVESKPTGKPAGKSDKESAPAKSGAADQKVTLIKPGPNVQEEAQTVLIKAKPGDVIEFGEGTFDFTGGLSLTVEKVT